MSAPRPSGLRLLVTGGRDFTDRIAAEDALDTLRAAFGVAVLIEGGAKGADTLARDWAVANGVPVESHPAEWGKHGRAAGPNRNGEMLRLGRPQLALAMPGGRGTADMVERLKAARVPTIGLRADGTSEVLVPLPAPDERP